MFITLEEASTDVLSCTDPASFPVLGANVTAARPGSFTTTLRPNDDRIWASSCWSMTFTSTPNAPSFATSSASSATPALAPETSILPLTAYSVEKNPASRLACNDGNGPRFPLSPATMPTT